MGITALLPQICMLGRLLLSIVVHSSRQSIPDDFVGVARKDRKLQKSGANKIGSEYSSTGDRIAPAPAPAISSNRKKIYAHIDKHSVSNFVSCMRI